MRSSDFIIQLKYAYEKADAASNAANRILLEDYGSLEENKDEYDNGIETSNPNMVAEIREGLMSISGGLGLSYVQVYHDVQDTSRNSWAGTAHELREIIAAMLRLLAPDEEITKQEWYKPVHGASGPTQKQRVIYILKLRNAGSKEHEVVEQVSNLDEMIASIVRSTYSRASDAAHRYKNRDEVLRILRYFEAFAYDLLDIK